MPFAVLLLEALLFSRYLVFRSGYAIPWDIRFYHLPHAIFISRALRGGEWPLWNPFIYCGMPFAANIQTALFYPLRALAVAAGTLTGENSMLSWLEADWVASMLLAGTFAYLLARRLGMNKVSALLTASTYQLGAFFASQAEHLGAIEIAAWLPLVWYACLDLPQRRSCLWLSAAVAMSFLGGFTPLTVVVLMSSLLFIRVRTLPAWLGCVAFGVLLAAAAVFPAVQLRDLSVSQFRTDWMGTGGGLPLAGLRTMVYANAAPLPGDPTFQYLYCGILSLALAFFGSATRIGLLACLFSFLMFGDSTAFGTLFYHLLPAFIQDAYYPQQWLAPFTLAVALCAGLGLERLLARHRFAWLLLPLAVFDLLWFNSARPINLVSLQDEPGVAADSFHGSPELTAAVRSNTLPDRLDTLDDSIDWVASAMITGIPTAGGQDPMTLVRYMRVRDIFCDGERFGVYYQVEDLQSPILNLLNVRSVITRTRPPQPYREVPGGYLYRNESVSPRFFLTKQLHRTNSIEDSIAHMRTAPEVTVLEGHDPFPVSPGSVTVENYRMNSVDLVVSAESPGYLASSEVNYPGWRAEIDGKPAPIFTTNAAFRGLPVPAGRHRVQFTFTPVLLYVSLAISAAAWVLWSLALGTTLWPARRRSKMPG